MTGYKFFTIYQALKLHFMSTYDCIKHSGKSKAINIKSYEKRIDTTRFDFWGGQFFSDKKAGQYCLANFVYNDHGWLYQSKTQSEEVFTYWKSRQDSQLHWIKNDINVLSETTKGIAFKDCIVKTNKGNKPPLLQLYLAGHVSKEFIIAADEFAEPFINSWSKDYENDPLVSDQMFILKKYKPFIVSKFDNDKLKEIFKEL
jgi:hypothetical protein